MNKFGGDWTTQKIDIITSYAKAYLTVMKDRKYFKLIYFDGFAGSGEITSENEQNIEGAALRILSIKEPRTFDIYYFVELDKRFANNLEKTIKEKFPETNSFVVSEDCNVKLSSLTQYLKKPENKYHKVLAFMTRKECKYNGNLLNS